MPRSKRYERDLPTRPSTLVDRRILPGVQDRESLNLLLRAHDPEVAVANRAEITATDLPLLRQIAMERPLAGGDPAARKAAIAWLGRFAGADDLNLLTELAQFDPDPGVRASALISLGTSGVSLTAPVLAAALASQDGLEVTAATKALNALADRIGVDSVRSSISLGRDASVDRRVKKALEGRGKSVRRKTPRRSSTRAD